MTDTPFPDSESRTHRSAWHRWLKRFVVALVIALAGRALQLAFGNLDHEQPTTGGTDPGYRLWDVKHRRQPPRPAPVAPPDGKRE